MTDNRLLSFCCTRCSRCCHQCHGCFCGGLCPECEAGATPSTATDALLARLCQSCRRIYEYETAEARA